MTTRFEQIAAAFPLHCQRIAECVQEQGGAWRLNWFMTDLSDSFDTEHGAGAVLQGAFVWGSTAEGQGYWSALANGVRLP